MRAIRVATSAVLMVMGILTTLMSGNASAATPNATVVPATQTHTTYIVWGAHSAAKSRVFHQVPGKATPMVIYSQNRDYDFNVDLDGGISDAQLYAGQACVNSGVRGPSCWLWYWRPVKNGHGGYFSMQPNGALVERGPANEKVFWSSNKAPGRQYNYALTLNNNGNLIEYYSLGNPLVAKGRHIAWETNRAPGAVRECAGGPIDSGITSFSGLFNSDLVLYVKVHSVNVLPLTVQVYRWIGNNYEAVSRIVLPLQTVTFKVSNDWYTGINGPTGIQMRTSTGAQSVLAAALVYGHCWYRP